MQRIADGRKGLLAGALLGALGGSSWIWMFDAPLFFTGDTILFGAAVCGLLGFLFGESFFEWLKEHFHWFT